MSHTRIDTHFHIVLPAYRDAINAAGRDPSGWEVPSWTPESALAAMDSLGVAKAVLSVTSPGPAIKGYGTEGRVLAHEMNEDTKAIVDKHPDRFGWFASMPDWTDTDGAIGEAEWALKEAGANGVVVMTSYQDKLLGHPSFRPIWDKLQELHAVVFIHPSAVNMQPSLMAGGLPQPVIDYPIATTRTAVDLVLTKTLSTHPDIKVILSHAGGTLPFLSERVLGILDSEPQFGTKRAEAEEEMKRFWVDVALSTGRSQLRGLLSWTTPDKILYGSDWPYVKLPVAVNFAAQLDEFVGTDEGKVLHSAYSDNAKTLLGW